METRMHEQVKLYLLIMNDMRSAHIEDVSIVAVSTSLDALQRWEKDQRAPERWKDGRFNKTYSQFTSLEWKNPTNMDPEMYGCNTFCEDGVKTEWVNAEELNRIMGDSKWIFVQEDY